MISLVLAAVVAAVPPAEVYRPAGDARSAAVLLGGPEDRALAAKLAARGALVLLVDAHAYAKTTGGKARCAYPAGELEALSQATQKRLKQAEYRQPVVIGTGEGAALAYAAVAQAPAGTFSGLLTSGFCPGAPLPKRFCGVQSKTPPAIKLPRWIALAPANHACEAKTFGDKVELRQDGLLGAYDALIGSTPEDPTHREPTAAPTPDAPVADLPLVEKPVGHGATVAALLITGDGGWAGIDQAIADAVNAKGVPLVALSSLRYFWSAKSPDTLGADVARILRHYSAQWGVRDWVLVGYSRGADVMPFAVSRLPAPLRATVRGAVLAGFETTTDFEVSPLELFHRDGTGPTVPTTPELDKLGAFPVACVYGDEEEDTACPKLAGRANVTVVKLSGGHHFNGNYGPIADEVLRLAGGAPPVR